MLLIVYIKFLRKECTMSESALASDLKTLGLTDYQAKCLLALMTIGVGTPRDVATHSGIPYPSAYDSLRSLAQKGWVEVASTRPAVYRVKEPAMMKEKVIDSVSDLFGKLQNRYENIRNDSTQPELIYTIQGRDGVRRKVIEILLSAEKEIIMVIPGMALNAAAKDDAFQRALGSVLLRKNLVIKVITDDSATIDDADFGENVEVRIRPSVLAIDLLCDREKALISLPDLSACGWVDSPVIASHFALFLDLLWSDSVRAVVNKNT
jgi:sugar-specific transcriptional regulator TrmB